MLRWKRTVPLLSAALAVALAVPPARATDDETARALNALKAVTKEGKGNEDAGPAWKTLVSKGGAALVPALEAFDDTNPTATNWLRAAVDAIAEKETAAGQKLPVEKLETFAKDTKNAPSARRVAYELIVSRDATAKDRLLPGFLNDKSADLRRDAVARELDVIEKAARPTLRAELEKLFAYARDKDQIDLIAKKIGATGGTVSVSEHFGFVTHAAIAGPFDSTGGKGFATVYPPEAAKDATGAFKGKGGAEVKWITADTTDKYGKFDLNRIVPKGTAQERYTDVAAYALTIIVAEKETPCEIRVASPNAVQLFLNEKKLAEHEEYHHGDPLDATIGRGVLKKGENVIVLKVCQNNQNYEWTRAWTFQMRVCDATGGPLPLKQKITADGTDKVVPLGYIPEAPATKEEKK